MGNDGHGQILALGLVLGAADGQVAPLALKFTTGDTGAHGLFNIDLIQHWWLPP